MYAQPTHSFIIHIHLWFYRIACKNSTIMYEDVYEIRLPIHKHIHLRVYFMQLKYADKKNIKSRLCIYIRTRKYNYIHTYVRRIWVKCTCVIYLSLVRQAKPESQVQNKWNNKCMNMYVCMHTTFWPHITKY